MNTKDPYNISTKSWRVLRTIHITEMGPRPESAELIWLVFHGYAQNPDSLVPEFKGIAETDHVIIPEGMSKFYRKGYEGEVVASWMTSRHRLDEIRDQQDYLNSIYDKLPPAVVNKIVVLGFSQGTATALRWMDQNHPVVHSSIIYAGWPPEDVDYTKEYWSNFHHYYILGDNDYFLSAERMDALRKLDFFSSCKPKEIYYEGTHRISREVLKNLRSQLLSTF